MTRLLSILLYLVAAPLWAYDIPQEQQGPRKMRKGQSDSLGDFYSHTISCGDVISQDIELVTNLVCNSSNGLEIAKPSTGWRKKKVKVDCNGRAIVMEQEHSGGTSDSQFIGLLIHEGAQVEFHNCIVQGFHNALFLNNDSRVTFQGGSILHSTDNGIEIIGNVSLDLINAKLVSSTAENRSLRSRLGSNAKVTIQDSTFIGVGFTEPDGRSDGIHFFGGPQASLTIDRTLFFGHGNDAVQIKRDGDYPVTITNTQFINNYGEGIHVEDRFLGQLIVQDCTLLANSGDGIKIDSASSVLLENINAILNDEDGIYIQWESEADIIIRNSVTERNGIEQERTDSLVAFPHSNLEINSQYATIQLHNLYACNDVSDLSALGDDASNRTSILPDLVFVWNEESDPNLNNTTIPINVEGSVVCNTLSNINGPSDFACDSRFCLEGAGLAYSTS